MGLQIVDDDITRPTSPDLAYPTVNGIERDLRKKCWKDEITVGAPERGLILSQHGIILEQIENLLQPSGSCASKWTISMAVTAASEPLLPALPPARFTA
jgi:hypothetical protein